MKRWVAFFVMGILAPLCFISCSGKGNLEDQDSKRLSELGNVFGEELQEMFIPYREDAQKLIEMDAVVVADDKTYNIDTLYDFYADYKAGSDTRIFLVFKSKSFVVTKVVFEGTKGYYFRYEFDPFDEANITIANQLLDEVEIFEDETLKKVELKLRKEKKTDIVTTFKNIVRDDKAA